MSAITAIHAQYRTLNHIVLLKAKRDATLVVKIFTLALERIFKQSFSSEQTAFPRFTRKTMQPQVVIKQLFQNGLLTDRDLPLFSCHLDFGDCEKEVEILINHLGSQISRENAEDEKFTCPLTFETFKEAVIDEHGHTFEKEAIEAQLKLKNECPINRQPISTLIPNRLIQQTIDEAKSEIPIPTFCLFTEEDSLRAERHFKMAQTYEQEGEFEEALKSYANTFKYTKSLDWYASLPLLFHKMQQPQKAVLAALYLFQYQLTEKNVTKAIETLKFAQQIEPGRLTLLLATLYYAADQKDEALAFILSQIGSLVEREPQYAPALIRLALNFWPTHWALYSYLQLDNFPIPPQERAHLLRKGGCHALEMKQLSIALSLLLAANAICSESWIDVLLISRLVRHNVDTSAEIAELQRIGTHYQQKSLFKEALKVYKIAVQMAKSNSEARRYAYGNILAIYSSLGNAERANKWYQKYLKFLMEQKMWDDAEIFAQDLMTSSNPPLIAFEALETIYIDRQDPKLLALYAEMGKIQTQNGQFTEAEKTHRKAYERYRGLDHLLALADVMEKQDRVRESVQMYFETAIAALLARQLDLFMVCERRIRQIDPKMENLDIHQKIHLLMSFQIEELRQRVASTETEIDQAQRKVFEVSQLIGSKASLFRNWQVMPKIQTLIGVGAVYQMIELSGGVFAARGASNSIELWNRDGTSSRILAGHKGCVVALTLLNDETFISGSLDRTMKLWNRDGVCLKTLEGHSESISKVIVLKDGTIVSGGENGSIKLWNREGICFNSLRSHTKAITTLVELKDGTLASGSLDGTIKLWSRQGTLLTTFEGFKFGVRSLLELEDGTLAITGSSYFTIKFVNRSGVCLKVFEGHTGEIRDLIELENGTLASSSQDKTVRIWNREGHSIRILQGHTGSVERVIELPVGILCSCSFDNTIKFWDNKGICFKTLVGHTDLVYELEKLADGTLASCSKDKTIKLWTFPSLDIIHRTSNIAQAQLEGVRRCEGELQTFKSTVQIVNIAPCVFRNWKATPEVQTVDVHTDSVDVLISCEDGTILSGARNGTIKRLKRDGTCIQTIQEHAVGNRTLLELKDGSFACRSILRNDGTYSVERDGFQVETLKLWSREGKRLVILEGHKAQIKTVLELINGNLVTGSYDQTIKFWRRDGSLIRTLEGHTSHINTMIELQDGIIASGSEDKTIKLWDTHGLCIRTLQGHTGSIYSIIELEDGTLVSGSSDNTIKFWTRSGKCLKTLQGHTGYVYHLIELKDGTLASGSFDGTIRVWSRSGNCLRILKGHSGNIYKLIELRDGTLASGSFDNTIKLWDRNGICIQTLQGHTGHVYDLIELPDNTLASASNDMTIKFWTFPPDYEKQRANELPMSLLDWEVID